MERRFLLAHARPFLSFLSGPPARVSLRSRTLPSLFIPSSILSTGTREIDRRK